MSKRWDLGDRTKRKKEKKEFKEFPWAYLKKNELIGWPIKSALLKNIVIGVNPCYPGSWIPRNVPDAIYFGTPSKGWVYIQGTGTCQSHQRITILLDRRTRGLIQFLLQKVQKVYELEFLDASFILLLRFFYAYRSIFYTSHINILHFYPCGIKRVLVDEGERSAVGYVCLWEGSSSI